MDRPSEAELVEVLTKLANAVEMDIARCNGVVDDEVADALQEAWDVLDTYNNPDA